MYWWLALAMAGLGSIFFVWHLWTQIHDPHDDAETRLAERGFQGCVFLIVLLLAVAMVGDSMVTKPIPRNSPDTTTIRVQRIGG